MKTLVFEIVFCNISRIRFDWEIILARLSYRISRSACRWHCNLSIGRCATGWDARIGCHYCTDRSLPGSCTKKSRGIPWYLRKNLLIVQISAYALYFIDGSSIGRMQTWYTKLQRASASSSSTFAECTDQVNAWFELWPRIQYEAEGSIWVKLYARRDGRSRFLLFIFVMFTYYSNKNQYIFHVISTFA